MSNIAEGFESRTRARFIDLLGQAKASAGEVRCQLVVARDQDYLIAEECDRLSDVADKASRQLYNLIEYLEEDAAADQVPELPTKYVSR